MLSLALPADSPSPPVAGRYDVIARIGVGGMGVVHRVRDRQTDRLFAIKRPRLGGLSGSAPWPDPRASLARESLTLARLAHPHIVRFSDAGTDELGDPFLVLELLEQTRMIVDWRPASTHAQRLSALVQLFAALAHVHAAKLVHGDVTPSNVLLCARPTWPDSPRSGEPRVCLIDFGLATDAEAHTTPSDRETSPPSLVGSALYLAPELIEGAPLSTASDLYAAGMIAAEVLTGTDPRRRASPRTTLTALRDFPRTWLDDTLGALGRDSRAAALLRCLLAIDPVRRCSCADEVVAELQAIGRAT
ncbi:MAG: serine/threonine-protein kinase [Polyangiaceae bacterium]|jgi:eukaryotic-like serine/threonine-protein kinase